MGDGSCLNGGRVGEFQLGEVTLTGPYSCTVCRGMFNVTPPRGAKEALRCGCGDTNLNLTGKAGG